MHKSILGEQEQSIILAKPDDVFLRLDLIFDPLFLF